MRLPVVHGYLIAKIINDVIGPYAKASNGRIYPLLSKLEQTGLIVARADPSENETGRQSRSFEITEAGRQRWHQLMMDTNSNPREYREIFAYKATVLSFLPAQERVYLIDHYVNYCQAHILHLTAEANDIRDHRAIYYQDSSQADALLNVMQHLEKQWRLELTWAKGLREEQRSLAHS